MFPFLPNAISRPVALPPPPATVQRTAAVAPQHAPDATTDGLDRAAFCDEVVRVLHSDEPVGGRMRAATLALIVALDAWPRQLPIRLHTEGGDRSGRRYGPVDAPSGHVESLHVKHTADGRYAIAAFADVPAERWWDWGADPDSLFEAVLAGLQYRDAAAHGALTDLLKAGKPAGKTDAQWLRQGLANRVERDRETALQALEPVFKGWATAAACGPVDGQLLREIAAMGPVRLQQTDRCRLAEIYNVAYSTLTRAITRHGEIKPAGRDVFRCEDDPDHKPAPVTPAILRDIDAMGVAGIKAFGGVEALARHYQCSNSQLAAYVSGERGLTSLGRRVRDDGEARAEMYANKAARLAGEAQAILAGSIPASVAERRNEVLAVLRGNGVVDGQARHATLALLPTLRDWPRGTRLVLHANSNAGARQYGPPDPAGSHATTIHLQQWPDGRYAAAVGGDPASGQWVDCGAGAHSLFQAVIVGLRMPHLRLPWPDGQRLRQRLAEDLVQAHAPTMHALGGLAALPKQRPSTGLREVDAWMLRDIAATPKERRVSLEALGRQYRVKERSLHNYLRASDLQPTPVGAQFIRKQEDPAFVIMRATPAIIRALADRFAHGIPRQEDFQAAIDAYPVAYHTVCAYIDQFTGRLTPEGRVFVASAADPTAPGTRRTAAPPAMPSATATVASGAHADPATVASAASPDLATLASAASSDLEDALMHLPDSPGPDFVPDLDTLLAAEAGGLPFDFLDLPERDLVGWNDGDSAPSKRPRTDP